MDTKETQKTNQAAGGEKKNGLCRIVTKKRLGGLAAVIVIALIAGAGWNAYHHQKMAAMRQQEHAALSQMNTIQAEKLGLSLLSEDQARSAAAEAIGQDVSAISFDEVSLLTDQQMRKGEEKKEHKRGHKEKKDRRDAPQGAPGRDGGPAMLGQLGHPQGQPPQPGEMQGQPPRAQHPQGPAPDAQAPQGQPGEPKDAQAQGKDEQRQGGPQKRPAFRGGFPHFSYLVRCTVNGMHYALLVNAADGTVLPLGVHAAR
jgi:hypothetical protein